MKVLFSLTYYTPYISGLTLYVKRLAEAFVRSGYQVSVITNQHEKKLKLKERIDGVEVFRAKPLFKVSKGYVSFDWAIQSFVQAKKHDVAIINLPQVEGFVPAILGKLFGKKVISIYHCEVVLPFSLFNLFVQFMLTVTNLVALFVSDQIVTYTEDFAENSRVLPLFAKKIKYIYPPVKEQKINKRVQKVLIHRITPKPKFVIGIAARLAAEKGLEYVFESIPILKAKIKNKNYSESKNALKTARGWPDGLHRGGGIKIVIAGSMEPAGEEEYKKKIMKLVKKYKEYIIFLGELKEEEMGSFYSILDVLVLPSINSTEAFGMVQVEAMTMGIPVVAVDLPGVRIPIKKTGMGKLVPAKDSSKLAEAVVEVLANKKRYINGRSIAKREFSFQKTVNFYEKLLQQLHKA